MTQVPNFVADRITRPAHLKYIVENSTPVVCFGDVTQARVLTIGINPSSSEFTKLVGNQRQLLSGSERKLADLVHLRANSTESLTPAQVSQIWQNCLDYFDGPYYKSWFSKMQESVLDPMKASYVGRSAAHLDLIQWATDPLWQKMLDDDPQEAAAHLAADLPFLEKQLEESSAEIIFLSGTPVIETLKNKFQLTLIGKTDAKGKTSQNNLFLGNWNGTKVLGTSMNVPDSYTSNAHRDFLRIWISENI